MTLLTLLGGTGTAGPVTVFGTMTGTLGSLTGTMVGTRTVNGTMAGNLGGLSGHMRQMALFHFWDAELLPSSWRADLDPSSPPSTVDPSSWRGDLN